MNNSYGYQKEGQQAEIERRLAEAEDNRPVYVQRLDRERREAQAELVGLQSGLLDLVNYLYSPKFAEHRYVNVDDVILRLQEAKAYGLDLRSVA